MGTGRMRMLVLAIAMSLLAAACGAAGGEDPQAGGGDTDAGGGTGTEAGGAEDGGELLERARQEGIRIGFANEVPYGYLNEQGEPTGEAPELAKVILEEMGITEIDASVVEFGALINGLNAGRFDMIAAGMFINEDRASQALFTDPDYCATTAFAVPAGNPMGLTDFSSITETGATLGVLSGAVEDEYAVQAGVPDDQIERLQTTADLVDALTSGRIDAFALTAITVREQTEPLEGFEATDGFVPVIDGEEQLGCGGFVFSFDNKQFRDQFNEILLEMRANDEILPIIEEFGFTQAETEAAKGVSVEDLIGQPYDFAMDGGGAPAPDETMEETEEAA